MRRPAVSYPGAAVAAPWERSVRFGPQGWRGLPTPAPWQQNGAYAGPLLTQVPGNTPGVQLSNGRAGNDPGWSCPTASGVPSWLITQRPASVAGAQRFGGAPGNPAGAGPYNARLLQQSVLRAQVTQGGLGVMDWAQQIRQWSS